MVLRRTKMQSELKVEAHGEFTLTGGDDDVAIIDIESAPYGHGIHNIMLVLQNGAFTGEAILTAVATTVADGSGTEFILATMTIPISDPASIALEITHEMFSQASDRATAVDGSAPILKSLKFVINGTVTDTVDVVTVADLMTKQDGLTPSDVTLVT